MALLTRDIEKRFGEHHDRIHKLETDMYFGDGKENPSVATRLTTVENATAAVNKLTWVVILGIISAIGDIVSRHFH